jgi:hypothetical protein
MEPYERSELGGVGEGLCGLDRAEPLTAATSEQVRKSRCLSHRRGGRGVTERTYSLTQLQLGNKLPSLRNPLPLGEGRW